MDKHRYREGEERGGKERERIDSLLTFMFFLVATNEANWANAQHVLFTQGQREEGKEEEGDAVDNPCLIVP